MKPDRRFGAIPSTAQNPHGPSDPDNYRYQHGGASCPAPLSTDRQLKLLNRLTRLERFTKLRHDLLAHVRREILKTPNLAERLHHSYFRHAAWLHLQFRLCAG